MGDETYRSVERAFRQVLNCDITDSDITSFFFEYITLLIN